MASCAAHTALSSSATSTPHVSASPSAASSPAAPVDALGDSTEECWRLGVAAVTGGPAGQQQQQQQQQTEHAHEHPLLEGTGVWYGCCLRTGQHACSATPVLCWPGQHYKARTFEQQHPLLLQRRRLLYMQPLLAAMQGHTCGLAAVQQACDSRQQLLADTCRRGLAAMPVKDAKGREGRRHCTSKQS
jgi:hypothetical protein